MTNKYWVFKNGLQNDIQEVEKITSGWDLFGAIELHGQITCKNILEEILHQISIFQQQLAPVNVVHRTTDTEKLNSELEKLEGFLNFKRNGNKWTKQLEDLNEKLASSLTKSMETGVSKALEEVEKCFMISLEGALKKWPSFSEKLLAKNSAEALDPNKAGTSRSFPLMNFLFGTGTLPNEYVIISNILIF
jgi:hypothetical protein